MHWFFQMSHFIPQNIKTTPFPPAMLDFNVSSLTAAFRYSASLTFRERLLSPLYSRPQLHGIKYMQFLVILSNLLGFIQQRFLRRVELFLNIVLMLYEPQIFWNFFPVNVRYTDRGKTHEKCSRAGNYIHQKKDEGHNSRNVVTKTKKMGSIVKL